MGLPGFNIPGSFKPGCLSKIIFVKVELHHFADAIEGHDNRSASHLHLIDEGEIHRSFWKILGETPKKMQ